jgi:hypothetical protein
MRDDTQPMTIDEGRLKDFFGYNIDIWAWPRYTTEEKQSVWSTRRQRSTQLAAAAPPTNITACA